MYCQDIANGDSAILPPKTFGRGAGAYTSSKSTTDEVGTVTKTGTGTVTIGYFDDVGVGATFVPYDDGLMTGNDVSVHHGKGVRLAVQVTGASGLRICYAGGSE